MCDRKPVAGEITVMSKDMIGAKRKRTDEDDRVRENRVINYEEARL